MIAATFNGIGRGINGFLGEMGGIFLFGLHCAKIFFSTRGNIKPIIGQIAYVSFRSLPTVMFAGVFVGAILVLQFNVMLKEYNAQIFLGGLNTSSLVREVGPLIISFLIAGKIGAFTAAELGTMKVTEQIDAIRCLGTNPIQYLIVPRFIGIIISAVILLAIGLMVSIGGSMLVAKFVCGINIDQFTSSIPKFTNGWTVFCGWVKASVYATIVAGVACYKGYHTSGGARGVGKAVTQAAIYTNFYIVLANYATTNLLDMIRDVGGAFVQGLY